MFMADFKSKYNGEEIDERLDKVKDMGGATSSAAGTSGLVPAPAAGKQASFLRGDGTWQDIGVNEIEDAVLSIVLQLMNSQPPALPQDSYNTIQSLFGDGSTSKIRMIKPSDSFVETVGGVLINDLMVFNDQKNKCITIYINSSNNALNMGFLDMSVSVYSDLSVGYVNSILNISSSNNSEVVIERSFRNTKQDIDFDNQLHLKLGGAGNKALMDDGTYKEIGSSGVDISNYILEGVEFKKSTTKEGFDKIKGCIINKQHMYVYYKVNLGGETIVFHSDVISSSLYESLVLIMYGSSYEMLAKLIIDPSNYSITATKL